MFFSVPFQNEKVYSAVEKKKTAERLCGGYENEEYKEEKGKRI